MQLINIVIIENDNFSRIGLELILTSTNKFIIAASTKNKEDGLLKVELLKPDAVIINIDFLPCGTDFINDIKKIDNNIKIIVITASTNQGIIREVINNGVDCCYCKISSHEQAEEKLIEAILAATRNELWVDPCINRIYVNSQKNLDKEKLRIINSFSQKEIDILRLMAGGVSHENTANRLYLSVGTVRAYLNTIYTKLGVGDRINAIREAINLDIISFNDMQIGVKVTPLPKKGKVVQMKSRKKNDKMAA
ncbi:MAG: response regulator transcription factor [Scytonematopsis contorta HA4267-MV1]|jgi:DNA-binding NarL/FixJ family response regulator|nr:response regulator transcription factor [Scytonematopsis contorta HA4267-MV1]